MRMVIGALAALALVSGCTVRHDVVADYPQYLINNRGESHLPTTSAASKYALTPGTRSHHYEFRSAMAGRGNLWIVEFGRLLDQTMQSGDVQAAFGRIEPAAGNDPRDSVLVFDLQDYVFADMSAHIRLRVTHVRGGAEVFSRTYDSDGRAQGGKVFWGGAMAMKNAVQQSTKLALDEILRRLIADLNARPPEA